MQGGLNLLRRGIKDVKSQLNRNGADAESQPPLAPSRVQASTGHSGRTVQPQQNDRSKTREKPERTWISAHTRETRWNDGWVETESYAWPRTKASAWDDQSSDVWRSDVDARCSNRVWCPSLRPIGAQHETQSLRPSRAQEKPSASRAWLPIGAQHEIGNSSSDDGVGEPRLRKGKLSKSARARRRRHKKSGTSILQGEDEEDDLASKVEAVMAARGKCCEGRDPEIAREDLPLVLLKDKAQRPQDWEPIVADVHSRSWAFLRRSCPFVTQNDLDDLVTRCHWEELVGRTGDVTRKTVWMVRHGCRCAYSYGGGEVQADDMPSWMFNMMQRWLQEFNLEYELPNCVNLNLYECGAHSVGWHADDEPLFQSKFQDARVISVSLGANRRFRIGMRCTQRSKKMAPAKGTISSVELQHGDLCTMEGLFQKHYLHALSRNKSLAPSLRVNATFRWIVKHARGCPLHEESEASGSDSETSSEVGESSLRRRKVASARSRRRGRGLGRALGRNTAAYLSTPDPMVTRSRRPKKRIGRSNRWQ